MSEPFVGEIRMFAGTFAPQGWAFCDGQLLAISENDALFSLLGTIYGGDGQTTFGLPDLRGRLPVHAGSGPGLSPRNLGSNGGAESVTLTTNQLPSHTHAATGSGASGTDANPGGNFLAGSTVVAPYVQETPDTPFAATAITATGGNQPHANLMPYLCVHFIIALFGIYPSRQ